MITILSALVSLISFRVRNRASLELELVALRHQVTVLRRQRPGQLRLFSTDRVLWVWLYRVWPQAVAIVNLCLLKTPKGRESLEISQGQKLVRGRIPCSGVRIPCSLKIIPCYAAQNSLFRCVGNFVANH